MGKEVPKQRLFFLYGCTYRHYGSYLIFPTKLFEKLAISIQAQVIIEATDKIIFKHDLCQGGSTLQIIFSLKFQH